MIQLTKTLSGILIAVSIVFYACRSSNISPELPPDYIVLRPGILIPTSVGVTAIADSISVSICPADAYCFAPNNATISLRLSKGTQSHSMRLFAWIPNYSRRPTYVSGPTDSTTIELGGQRYKVILRDGRYATTTGSENRPEAVIQVSPMK